MLCYRVQLALQQRNWASTHTVASQLTIHPTQKRKCPQRRQHSEQEPITVMHHSCTGLNTYTFTVTTASAESNKTSLEEGRGCSKRPYRLRLHSRSRSLCMQYWRSGSSPRPASSGLGGLCSELSRDSLQGMDRVWGRQRVRGAAAANYRLRPASSPSDPLPGMGTIFCNPSG